MKKTNQIKQNIIEISEYKGYTCYIVHFTMRGNIYSVTLMVRPDKTESVVILKLTNNPFGLSGKTFDDFNHAAANYKSAEMRIRIFLIQSEITDLRKKEQK